MENGNTWAKIANQWNKYSRPAYLDPHRIGYKEYPFSIVERNIKSWLDLLPKTEKSFEFGCREGLNLIYLISTGKVNKGIGIDISTGALNGASLLAKAFEVGNLCEFKYMNYLDFIPNHDESYGIILSIQFINYVADLDTFFIKCCKITDTGSIILIHDVQRNSLLSLKFGYNILKRSIMQKKITSSDILIHYYRCDEIKNYAKKYGFSVISEHYAMPYYFFPIMIIQYKLFFAEYKNENVRLFIKGIYLVICAALEVFSKILSTEKNSMWYYVMLRKL